MPDRGGRRFIKEKTAASCTSEDKFILDIQEYRGLFCLRAFQEDFKKVISTVKRSASVKTSSLPP